MVFVDVAEAARPNDCKWAALPFYKGGTAYDGERLKDPNAGGQKDSRDKRGNDKQVASQE